MESKLKKSLAEKGLKATPKRMSILRAIMELKHPTAEEIIRHVRSDHPDIAVATVYKALNIMVERKVLKKVNTEKDVVRYDAVMKSHHHLHCTEQDRMEDYIDEGLTELLKAYFRNKKILGFDVEDFKLNITGSFTDK